MVLHASGTIFASQIRNEFNQNTSGTFFLGNSGRSLDSRLPQSGQINFSNFFNKYFRPSTNNLKVWLDAKEYPGSGTTWTDLQGNANGTLINTPTFTRPYFEFNGTNQTVSIPDVSNVTDFTSSDSYTISCWVWVSSTQNTTSEPDNDIIEKAGIDGYPYVIRFIRSNSGINVLSYNGTTNPGLVSNSIILNEWNHISAVFDWPSRNFLTNESFTGGTGISQESGSRPTNTIVQLANPGDSEYVLRQNGNLAEYQLNLTTQLQANTTYTLSGWYSKSLDYNGIDTMFHSRAMSSSGNHSAINDIGLHNILETRIVGGLTWYFCYATITTPSDYSNQFYWYVGYGTNNTTGFRYYTKLSVIKGNYPKRPLNVYINGQLNKDSNMTYINPIDNSNSLYLMSRYGTTNFVTGRFGMLMIHNAALAASEISRMYYATRNVFEIDSIELENGTWNIVYEYVNPKRNASNALVTSKDNATTLGTPTVNRIGYFMQNNMGNGSTMYWILVTMDAYTSTLSDLKIPDAINSFVNQRNVNNLRIYSNHPQVGHYTTTNGRLEIWPSNYGTGSGLGGGNNSTYDVDDDPSGGTGYGCAQVHDMDNVKTLLSWTDQRLGHPSCIGIGNNDPTNIHYAGVSGREDWTFANNGAYNWKFQVLIGTIPIEPTTMEAGTWRLLYEITNPKRDVNGMLTYSKNNSGILGDRQFSRIGYYMQNNMGNGATSYYTYVTMDAYTTSLRDIKIPDLVDSFTNQRFVQNLNVYSNHPQIGNYSSNSGIIGNISLSPPTTAQTISSDTFTISDATFGNGTFIVTKSGNHTQTGREVYNIFRDTAYWGTPTGTFSTSGGSGTQTRDLNPTGTGYLGEWAKIQLPYNFILTSIELIPQLTNRGPRDFAIFGSTDNTNWTQLLNVTDSPLSVNTYNIPNTSEFNYYIYVISKTWGGDTCETVRLKYFGIIPGVSDYGSLQIQDTSNSRTLISWNNHKNANASVDIGIGNNDVNNIHYNASGTTDWINAQNGAYNWKFQVYVQI